MTDKPCTHCGGTGQEPDPLLEAARKHAAFVNGAGMTGADKDRIGSLGAAIHAVALAEREQHEARIVFLEAALRDVLDFFPGANSNRSAATTSRMVPWDRIAGWRDILNDNPGRLIADGTCPCGARSLRDCVRPTEPTCPGGC